jgi:hypothetical protein
LQYFSFENRDFTQLAKHHYVYNTAVFENTAVFFQNCRKTLFPNTPVFEDSASKTKTIRNFISDRRIAIPLCRVAIVLCEVTGIKYTTVQALTLWARPTHWATNPKHSMRKTAHGPSPLIHTSCSNPKLTNPLHINAASKDSSMAA